MNQSKLKKHKKKPIEGSDPEFLTAIRLLPCITCGQAPPSTASHIKTRGSGGKDDYFNVVPQCLDCHRYFEDNRLKFIMMKPHFLRFLKELGWEISFTFNKLIMTHESYKEKNDTP